MRKNTVKLALAEGKLQLGTGFGQLRSQEIATILAAAGFHWAFLDTEHGGFDLETVQDICRLAEGSYVQIDAHGGPVVALETPFDRDLARINGELAKRTLSFGTVAAQTAGAEKAKAGASTC